MDDADGASLLPAVLVLTVNGAMGAMIAIQVAAAVWPIGVLIGLATVAALGACHALDLDRPWSLRLAAAVAPLGAPVWIAALLVADVTSDGPIAVVCAGMALASVWTGVYLGRLADGPDWLRAPMPTGPAAEREGWIEELPYRVRGNPRSTEEVPGSGQRAVTTFPRV